MTDDASTGLSIGIAMVGVELPPQNVRQKEPGLTGLDTFSWKIRSTVTSGKLPDAHPGL